MFVVVFKTFSSVSLHCFRLPPSRAHCLSRFYAYPQFPTGAQGAFLVRTRFQSALRAILTEGASWLSQRTKVVGLRV